MINQRLRLTGLSFIALAIFFSTAAYLWPEQSSHYALILTKQEKEPFYAMSGLLIFAGMFCLMSPRQRC